MVLATGHEGKGLVLQCINSLSLNLVEVEPTICQFKNLIPTLLVFIFRRIYIYIYREREREKTSYIYIIKNDYIFITN